MLKAVVTIVVLCFVAVAGIATYLYFAETDRQHREINSIGGLPELGNWNEIVGVDFDDTMAGAYKKRDVNDSDLKLLREIETIRYINLSDTMITDAGLEHLKTHPRLERLYLDGTFVTSEGVVALKKTLPKCEIYW